MELFKLFGIIAVNNAEALHNLENTGNKAEKTQGKLSKAFDKIGSAAVACGKVIATGLAVGTAAFASLTTKAMSLAGELEQNMGGAAAVFGEHASKMEEAAKSAFSSMGLSASDFLGTANKMGSLFKGAGFEAGEAADLTASAMQRAADVASIMGIDVSAAMESIAGAAKGNFTMMDNLGVAMNDTNLQAYALSKGIEKTTQQMTSQEKIGLAMQMFMEKTADYAGNYAKENETLAGSLTTAKAALSNFLSGVGDANEVATALASTGKVISQKLLGLLPALVSGLSTLFNALIPELPPLISSLLPAVLDGAVGLIEGAVSAAGTLVRTLMDGVLPKLGKAAMQIMESLGSALIDNIEFILDSALQIAEMLAFGLLESLPKIADAACTIVEKLGFWIEENAEFVIESGINLISKLTTTLVREIPKLIQAAASAVAKCIPALLKSFSALWTQFDSGLAIVTGLLIAFKGFAIVTKVISLIKALKAAILGLNLALNVNPLHLLISVIGLAIAAFGFLSLEEEENKAVTIALSDEYDALREKIEESTSAMQEAMDTHEENAKLISDETEETENLWKELQTLTDETGYVTDANKDRANYLLGELNEALGTEYEMNGNIIGQYQTMQTEIDKLIKMKQAERLLDSYGDAYTTAKMQQDALIKNAQTAEEDWQEETGALMEEISDDLEEALALLTPEQRDAALQLAEEGVTGEEILSDSALGLAFAYMSKRYPALFNDETRGEKGAWLAGYLPLYDALADSNAALDLSYRTISNYEAAEEAAAAGDYDSTIEWLTDTNSRLWSRLEQGEKLTGDSIEALEEDLGSRMWRVSNYYDNLIKGVEGYTADTLRDYIADFEKKQGIYETATGEKLSYDVSPYRAFIVSSDAQQLAENQTVNASQIELPPVTLADDAISAIKDLRVEIARLAEAVGLVNSDVSIKINNRVFGRLVKEGVK